MPSQAAAGSAAAVQEKVPVPAFDTSKSTTDVSATTSAPIGRHRQDGHELAEGVGQHFQREALGAQLSPTQLAQPPSLSRTSRTMA